MNASPVKTPVLPPSGVSVPPPVATSPQKVGVMQMPPPLANQLSKPPNMNHSPMPLSLIADHKMVSQFPPQPQSGIPPVMQPVMPSLSRTPEKQRDLPIPSTLSVKPTSNGMEGLAHISQAPAAPTLEIEPPTSAAVAPQKPDARSHNERPENNVASHLPGISIELRAPAPALQIDVVDKKAEPETAKAVEPINKTNAQPATEGQDPVKLPTANTAVSGTPTLSAEPAAAAPNIPAPAPAPAAVAVPAAAPATTTPAALPTKQPTPAPEKSTSEQPPPTPAAVAPTTTAAATTTATATATATATPSVSRTESSLTTHSKPEMKVATIPRQATKRKREHKVPAETPETKKEEKEDDRKSKRVRLPTQPYQSPIPELNIIAKMTKSTKSTPSKAPDDKLIVFYKNEFLAVRNAEGGFYVCQAMQNIYKSSARIRIRWLSQEEGKDSYSPDFYDHTDFDCILTNLNMEKVDKEKFKLPQVEQQRTESILKRALDVERGVSEKPPVTEEHPDGLDLSLFRDESQLKKSSKNQGKKTESSKSSVKESDSVGDEKEEKEERRVKKTNSRNARRKKKTSKKKTESSEKKAVTKSSNGGSKSVTQVTAKKSETRVEVKRKSSVSSTPQQLPEKRARKTENNSQSSDRTNKTKSLEVAAESKPLRDRRTKSRK